VDEYLLLLWGEQRLSPYCQYRKIVVLTMLLVMSMVVIPRPVSATADFKITLTPSEVSIPLGYWADAMLTVTSLNGLEGSVQIDVPVGGGTGLYGAGFSTGMLLTSNGNVSTILMLTPGEAAGNYTVQVNVTVGPVVHSFPLPVTVSPITRPDFITRLWGSYSILQGWNTPVPEEITSLGGFEGQVNLTATVMPSIPDAPVVSFQQSPVSVSSSHSSAYTGTLSALRETPTGNYVVTVLATSGTMSHSYRAILMVGDYRPPADEPPASNATTTGLPNGGTNHQWSSILSPAFSMLESLWWLETAVGILLLSGLLYFRRNPRRI